MDEKKLIESKRYNIIKIAITIIIIGILIPLVWAFLEYTISAERSYADYVDVYQQKYPYSWEENIDSKAEYIKDHTLFARRFGYIPFCSFLFLAIIVYFGLRSYSLTVTDKRIYGKTWFGKRVDLPVDSVSAIGTISLFKGVSVATSSGKISFILIKNSKEIYEELNKLIVYRQYEKGENKSIETIKETSVQSNADEIKKYKDLLDSGVITQEEFDAKKKQLLGL